MKHWMRRAAAGVAALALGAAAMVSVPTGCSNNSGTSDGGSCSAGQTFCGSKCTNVKEDPENCGACGAACPMFSVCDLGVCAGGSDAASHEAGSDAASDATESDAPSDAASDAATEDAADAPSEGAPADAAPDGGGDTGVDAPADASLD